MSASRTPLKSASHDTENAPLEERRKHTQSTRNRLRQATLTKGRQQRTWQTDFAGIPGLWFCRDFVSTKEEQRLIAYFDQQEWNCTLRRRTQHYGYEYDYRSSSATQRAAAIPEQVEFLTERLVNHERFPERPDQMIVNEYQPGQGISAHTDRRNIFKDGIFTLGLGSDCIMNFHKCVSNTSECIPVLFFRRSALVMTKASRYMWKHEIPAVRFDTVDGHRKERDRRVSITFRKMIQQTKDFCL